MLVKDGGYVSGICEDCAVGGAYLLREDGARAKKCQEQLVLLTMGYEGGYVSGLCEDCAVVGAYLVREDGARAKKCQEQLVRLTMWS